MNQNFNYKFTVDYYNKLFKIKQNSDNQDEVTTRLAELNHELTQGDCNPEFIESHNHDLHGVTDMQSFSLVTQYPGLLIGIGNQHESKESQFKGEIQLGFTLDYVTGLPYISGSSIKGVLRSAFEHEDYIRELLGKENINVAELKENIFDGVVGKTNEKMYKRDIFYDAFVTKANGSVIELDTIAPHPHEKGDFSEPVPINFIKVGPNVTFDFLFELHEFRSEDGLTTITVGEKRQLFKDIISDLGVGAKTNVGYGVLE